MGEKQGKILQVLGPVVDVQFGEGKLPKIYDALTVDNNGETQVLEVHHLGHQRGPDSGNACDGDRRSHPGACGRGDAGPHV